MVKVNNIHTKHLRFVIVKEINNEYWYWGSAKAKANACDIAYQIQKDSGIPAYVIDSETDEIYG